MKHYVVTDGPTEGAGTFTYLFKVPQADDFDTASFYVTLTSEGFSLGSCTWQLMAEDGTTAINAATAWDNRGAASGYSYDIEAAPVIKLTISITGTGEPPNLKIDALLKKA